MRRPVLAALIAIIVLLLGATGILFSKYRTTTTEYVATKAAEDSVSNRYDEAINAIAEIQDSLNTIAVGDKSIRMLSDQLRSEQKLTAPRQHEALERIAVLKAGLSRTRERIQLLENDLRRGGIRVAGLQKMIGDLKRSVNEKESLMAQLTGRVDSLQNQVTGLAAVVEASQDTIRTQEQNLEDKRRELGTVYYIIGTKRDLTNNGVVISKGGVLGLGKTLEPSGRVDQSLFTPLDTDQETVVRIPVDKPDKVQIVSAQPVTSYQLQLVDGKVELHIIDPKEFRKIKHLVIVKG